MIEYNLIRSNERSLRRGMALGIALAIFALAVAMLGTYQIWMHTAMIVAVDQDTFGPEPICVGGNCLNEER
jgi:hypothetical protein